jgi:hypothetical protein
VWGVVFFLVLFLKNAITSLLFPVRVRDSFGGRVNLFQAGSVDIRFFERLSKQPQGLLIWSEFGGALQYFERSYMLGMKEFLTDLFDCRRGYKRELRNNELTIESPCISILAASTPEWLRSRIREDDLRGGFFPRFLFVPSMEKDKRLAIPPEPNLMLENRMVLRLKRLKELTGRADFSKVKDAYEEWSLSHEDELGITENAELFGGFYARLSIYTLKFAILYQVSLDGSLQIGSEALLRAIELTTFLKRSLRDLFSHDLVFTKDMRDKAKVLKLIQKQPGIPRSDLMNNAHLLKRQLDPILETLHEEGKVETKPDGKGKRYYPKEIKHVKQ